MRKIFISLAGLSILTIYLYQPAFAKSETFTITGAWDSAGTMQTREFEQETIKNAKFIMKSPSVYDALENCNYYVGGHEYYNECKIIIEAKLITNPAEKMYNGKEKEYLITKVLKAERTGNNTLPVLKNEEDIN